MMTRSFRVTFVNPENDTETASYFGDFVDVECATKRAQDAFKLDSPLKAEKWIVKSVKALKTKHRID